MKKRTWKIENSFSSYDPDSKYINLEYHLADNNRHQKTVLTNYKKEFGKIIKTDNFIKVEEFKKTQKLIDIKKKVSELTGFPIEIMIDFGYIGEMEEDHPIIYRYNKLDEKGIDVTDTILIEDSRYNDLQKIIEKFIYL